MNWLERAAREIPGTAETPAAETAKTPVSSFLAVPQGGIFQKSGDADADRAPSERDKPKFAGPPPGRSCATCVHFRKTPGKNPDGWCQRHRVETFGDFADGCVGGFTPVAQELERRRQAVTDRLKADPVLRYAFDVQGASPGPGAPGPVSVMLGLRDRDGRILTGLLTVPADRWPGVAVFSAFWRDAAETG